MNAPQQLALAQIDRRFSPLRLAAAQELRRLQASVQSEGIRDPVLVSTDVQPGCWVLVDGFKRVRVAQDMGLTHVWVRATQLDVAHAKAAILQCNQPRQGLCTLEEAWIVRSLCREQGLMQTQVAELLKRDPSWVCRRLKLAEGLQESLQNDVRQGLLSTTIACQLSHLQRCNQQQVAQAISDHQLNSRESSRLVQRLRNARQPQTQAVREMLEDPLRYIAGAENAAKHAIVSDSRLSQDGNRLRRTLLNWPGVCGQLTRELRLASAADSRILAPLIQDAVAAGMQAQRQLEATLSVCSAQPSPTQGEHSNPQAARA
jgi:ParB/RepB/Spo0J family partition protein